MKNWLLQRKLDRIGKHADPDPDFVTTLGKDIKMRIAPRPAWAINWKLAFGSITSIALVLTGTGAYAYTSDDVLPDHPLYTIRENIERFEEAVAFTDEKSVEVKLKHLRRRINEQQLIMRQNKALTQAQMERFMKKMDKTLDDAGRLPGKEQERADRIMIKLENEYAKGLQNASERIKDEQTRKKIDAVIVNQKKKMHERIETLEEKRKERIKQQMKLRQPELLIKPKPERLKLLK